MMAQQASKNAIALNALHTAYLADPDKGHEPLLDKVRSVAKRAFHDEDFAQEFVIIAWEQLRGLKDLPCTFGGWIWRRLQWRHIDYIRSSQTVLYHELQVPEMVNHDGIPWGSQETLDYLACHATQDSIYKPPGQLDSVPDPFIRRVAQELLAGYTQHEIALRLGVNPSTLRSRLLRYRRTTEQVQELRIRDRPHSAHESASEEKLDMSPPYHARDSERGETTQQPLVTARCRC